MGSQWEGDTCAPSTLAAITTLSAVSLSSSPTAATISLIKSPRCFDDADSAKTSIVPRSLAPAFLWPLVHSRTSASAPRVSDGSNERTSRLAAADGLPVNGGGSVADASDGPVAFVDPSFPFMPSAASFAAPTASTSANAFTPFASTGSATPASRNGSSDRACGSPHPSGKVAGSTSIAKTSSPFTSSITPPSPSFSSARTCTPGTNEIHLAHATWNADRTDGVLSEHSVRTPGANVSLTSSHDTRSKSASTATRHAVRTCECLC